MNLNLEEDLEDEDSGPQIFVKTLYGKTYTLRLNGRDMEVIKEDLYGFCKCHCYFSDRAAEWAQIAR